MKNPKQLLDMWIKIKGVYGKGQKPADRNLTGERKKTGISKGLKQLQILAPTPRDGMANRQRFEEQKQEVVAALNGYYRFLEISKEKRMLPPDFLASIKKLARLVGNLEVKELKAAG